MKYLALLLFIPSLALAHDWYSPSCCSSQDCHPIDSCAELTEDNEGAVHWGKYKFEKSRVHPSEDSKCHVCIHDYGGTFADQPMCVYVQQGS